MMEKHNEHIDTEKGMDQAFETTYRVVTGRLSIQNLLRNADGKIFVLYDPHHIEQAELEDILFDMIDYFVDYEEYEKCQEIKDLINSDLSKLITKITLSKEDVVRKKRKDGFDNMLDLIKSFTASHLKYKKARHPKPGEYDGFDIEFSDKELWDVLQDEDKELFVNNYEEFKKWTKRLDIKTRTYYTKRLVDGKPLIPPFDETGGPGTWTTAQNGPKYNPSDYFDFEEPYVGEEDVNYNNMVVSFIGNLTCISNYNKEKINKIRFQLISFGILEVELRTKEIDGKTLYTIVYDNQGRVNKISWGL